MKTCEVCGAPIVKTKQESPSRTRIRKFCSRTCSNTRVHKRGDKGGRKEEPIPDDTESYITRTMSTRTERMQTYRADTITVIPRGLVKAWCPVKHRYYMAEVGTVR